MLREGEFSCLFLLLREEESAISPETGRVGRKSAGLRIVRILTRILNPDDSQPDRFSANRILRILSRILRFSTRPIFGQPGRFLGRSLTLPLRALAKCLFLAKQGFLAPGMNDSGLHGCIPSGQLPDAVDRSPSLPRRPRFRSRGPCTF